MSARCRARKVDFECVRGGIRSLRGASRAVEGWPSPALETARGVRAERRGTMSQRPRREGAHDPEDEEPEIRLQLNVPPGELDRRFAAAGEHSFGKNVTFGGGIVDDPRDGIGRHRSTRR